MRIVLLGAYLVVPVGVLVDYHDGILACRSNGVNHYHAFIILGKRRHENEFNSISDYTINSRIQVNVVVSNFKIIVIIII